MSEDLKIRLEVLEEEISVLKEAIQYLSYSKVLDERFAFFDWLVKYDVFGERRTRLDRVLLILGSRLDGEPCRRKSPIPNVSSELLYGEGRPTFGEARTLVMQALEVEAPSVVDELFNAFSLQGIQEQLVALRHADHDA